MCTLPPPLFYHLPLYLASFQHYSPSLPIVPPSSALPLFPLCSCLPLCSPTRPPLLSSTPSHLSPPPLFTHSPPSAIFNSLSPLSAPSAIFNSLSPLSAPSVHPLAPLCYLQLPLTSLCPLCSPTCPPLLSNSRPSFSFKLSTIDIDPSCSVLPLPLSPLSSAPLLPLPGHL